MPRYAAFLRGVNVGGQNKLSMAALRGALEREGLSGVRTLIASGNVVFEDPSRGAARLAARMEGAISESFGLHVRVAVFARAAWRRVIEEAPPWWGEQPGWRHNLLILIAPCTPADVAGAIGELREGIDRLAPGRGVVYQSIALDGLTRSAGLRVNRYPVYDLMTVRGAGTAKRVLELLEAG